MVGLLVLVQAWGLGKRVLVQNRLTCHPLGQASGRCDGLRELGDEVPQEVFEDRMFLALRLNARGVFSDGDRGTKRAVPVAFPVEAVGMDQVCETRIVAVLVHLLCVLQVADVQSDSLGRQVANRDVNDEVACPDVCLRGVFDWGQMVA